MKKILLLMVILLSSLPSYAVIADLGIDPLDQSTGVRAIGMGMAYVAVTDDINCIYYNPAAIAYTRGLTVTLRSYNNFSLAAGYDTPAGSFGLGLINKSNDIFSADQKSTYERSMGLVTYAYRFDRFSFGVSAKSLFSQRISVTGSADVASIGGYDADIGMIWKPLDYAALGLVLRNVMAYEYTMGGTKETMPRATRAGLSIGVLGPDSIFYNDIFGMKLAFDAESGNAGNSIKSNSYLGAELSYGRWLFFRFGSGSVYLVDSSASASSFGIGLKFNDMEIDMAGYKEPLTDSNVYYIGILYTPAEMIFLKQPEKKKAPKVEEKPKPVEIKEILTVGFPPDDYMTYDDVITISGEVRPGGEAIINGVNAYVGQDSRFSAMQQLLPGKNLIEIEGRSGTEKNVISRKVLRKAKIVIAEEEGLNKKIVDEVLNKETELLKRTEKLKKDKEKGIDVTSEEIKLGEERSGYETRKTQLYDEKKKLEERKGKVEDLATLGVIEVSPNKSFEIEAPIARGEMISWLVKSAGLPVPKVEGAVLSDVPANHKYAPFIKAALDLGLVKAVDNKFRPDDVVTEDEGQEFFKAFGVIK